MESGHVALAITGMTCGHCVAAVKKALARYPGSSGRGDLSPPRAVVSCEPLEDDRGDALKATAEEGYPSTPAAG